MGLFSESGQFRLPTTPAELHSQKANLVEGGNPQLAFGRVDDIALHLEMVKAEFIGRPQLCYLIAVWIVFIRRNIANDAELRQFIEIVERETAFIIQHMSSRWLISISDTYGDHGTATQRIIGTMISSIFNVVKLCETERLIIMDAHHSVEKLDRIRENHRHRRHIELWDGMTAYSIDDGDMPRNTIGRFLRVADTDAVLSSIARTLLERALAGDTVLHRLAAYNIRFSE